MLLGLYAFVAALLGSLITELMVADIQRGISCVQTIGITVVRAHTVHAIYPQSVEFFKDVVGLEEMAAVVGTIFVATFLAAVCCLPFEYVMIEIKKMQPDDKGKYPYTGFVDCAVKTLIAGGPLKFYTGFSIYCARIFSYVTMQCIFRNQLDKWDKRC